MRPGARGQRPALPRPARPALLTARSAVGTATDYVTTHRGAVAGEARTWPAEARRHLDQAEAAPEDEATAALAEAQWADPLARQEHQLAERDVRGYGNPFGAPGSSARWRPAEAAGSESPVAAVQVSPPGVSGPTGVRRG
ncbi:hypothetical protein [Streptomyces sp. NPDC003006]